MENLANPLLRYCIIILCSYGALACSGSTKHVPDQLKTEYLTNPVGLDIKQPRLSWILNDDRRGAAQSAYRIIVSDSRRKAEHHTGNQWDSDKITSDSTLNIPYSGKPLESNKTYYWRVRTWDQDGKPGSWSQINTFHTGLLNNGEWQASWITIPDSSVNSPLFRNDFTLDEEIASAYAFVTGVGYYEFYLNGQKVGNHVLDPAITNYENKILYETYEVTPHLKAGKNGVGFWLGNGGYRINRSSNRWTWYGTDNFFGNPAGLMQLHVQFKDGSSKIITTNNEWKTSNSPIIYQNVYGGEDYDHRLEQPGWSKAGYDDSSWQQSLTTEKPDITLSSQLIEPMRVTQTLEPKRQINPEPGKHIYDFKQNFPGWWQIKVKGEAGAQIKVRASETLNDSLFPTPLEQGDQISTYQPYHDNVWTTYTLRGDGEEQWEPRFFYTGFRYLEVTVSDPDKISDFEIYGRVMHSDIDRNGSFSCSNTLLNQIYDAAVWSQKGNLHGYPTDCPHREKGAYNGDGQVIAETSMHDFHMQPMYTKWVNDMRDSQYENGRIPNTSPEILGGTGGGIAWGSAYILIPWWMYQYYEDRAILENHYETMKAYMGYLHDLARNDSVPSEEYIINEFGGKWDSIGEWEAPVRDRNGPVNPVTHTYYWYLDNIMFAKIAGELGYHQDQQRYRALADTIKEAFNHKFFDPETNLYGTSPLYQTYQLYALSGNLVPEANRQDVLDGLITDIMEPREGHLATGILGTKHLVNLLPQENREEILHTVATQTTYPSWGYWIKNGATTLWENWAGKNSHNHQMFGTINEYFYKYLAGIRSPVEGITTPGYKHIHIKPYIPDDLQFTEASLETVRGKVSSRWQKNDNYLVMHISIPANATAEVDIPLPSQSDFELKESETVIWSNGRIKLQQDGITELTRYEDYLKLQITSGTYQFQTEL